MEKESWSKVITPTQSLLKIDFKALWKYRDLIMLFVKRDVVTLYKQTILGPLWFLITPIITTLTYTVIFGRLANISTDELPQPLFYLAGVTLWTYFQTVLTETSNTFFVNQSMFSKVYFPRMVMPLSIVISNLVKFAIQFFLFLMVWIYYYYNSNSIHPNLHLLFIPVYLLILILLSLGLGMIISSLTTKYRDLKFLITFGIQLFMYATPIVYPLSIASGNLKLALLLNPLSQVVEGVRLGFFGTGYFEWSSFTYSLSSSIIIFFIGTVIFNKVEKSFIDTV